MVLPAGGESVAAEVLKQTVGVAPRIRKAQGDVITVLVERDVDFRSVYRLQRTQEA